MASERKIKAQSKNFTKKDFINSRNGMALQEVAGKKLTIKSCAVIHDEDSDNENEEVGTIVAEEGIFTTISDNIIDSILDIIEIEEEESGPIVVNIQKRTSKQGREFLTLTIE